MKYFKEKSSEVLKELIQVPRKGLSDSEVQRRLTKYGYNEFTKQKQESIWMEIKKRHI